MRHKPKTSRTASKRRRPTAVAGFRLTRVPLSKCVKRQNYLLNRSSIKASTDDLRGVIARHEVGLVPARFNYSPESGVGCFTVLRSGDEVCVSSRATIYALDKGKLTKAAKTIKGRKTLPKNYEQVYEWLGMV